MPLEAGDGYISGLTITNPVGATDPKSQGDDHIRLIKAALKGTFPNLTGAVTLTQSQLNEAARLSAENVFTGATQTLSSIRPSLRLTETDATADEGKWNLEAQSDQLLLETLSDAGASGTALLTAVRTGNTASLALAGTTLTLNGINITDFARLSTSNTFVGALSLSNTAPRLYIDDTNAGTGLRQFYIDSDTGVFSIASASDAGSGIQNALRITKNSSGTITGFDVTATAITLNTVDVTDFARLSQNNTFTQPQNISTSGADANWVAARSGGASAVLSGSSSYAILGALSNHPIAFITNSATKMEISAAGNFDFKGGTVTTNNASASEVGFKGMPQNSQSDNYTLVLADAGKYILETGSSKTITIPANGSVAFPVGTVITIEANETLTIAITTDTLYLAGTNYGTTGSRTLARGGLATLLKRSSTSWIISGTGLS